MTAPEAKEKRAPRQKRTVPAVGETIHGYQLVEELGEGAHGYVYRAVKDGMDFALKVLKPEVAASDPGMRKRFIGEGEILRKLRHQNIVAFVEHFEEDRKHCIVTEFVNGGSIDDLIRGGKRMSDLECMQVVAQVLDALAFIHPHGIYHRDIKPSNILIDFKKIPRISDFGIAKMLDRNMTQANVRIGTREYMAPEMFRTGQVDERTEVYAAGVTLYEMLTGRRPIEPSSKDRDIFDFMKRVMKDPPTPPSRHRSVPSKLEAAIMKSLAKNPKERFQNAGEFRDALLSIQASLSAGGAEVEVSASLAEDAKAARIEKVERRTSTVEEPAPSNLLGPLAVFALATLVLVCGLAGFFLPASRLPAAFLGRTPVAIAFTVVGLLGAGAGTFWTLVIKGKMPWQHSDESPYHVYLVLGHKPGRIVPIKKPVIKLGRDQKNDLEVMDPRVSRFHGEIVFHSGAFHYRDLGSTNGSVHNQRTLQAGESAQLRPNDRLLLGGTPIKIVFSETPPRVA